MKKLITLTAVFYSVLSTVFLALGLTQTAVKFDPVAQKAQVTSTMEVAGIPCAPCGVAPDGSSDGISHA